MKIKILRGTNRDGDDHEEMYIDGSVVLSAYPLCECPEDATLERDMISCDEVETLMFKAFKAGKAGEDYSYEVELEE